jgi:ethylbenzene dioxygenase beta subunit
MTHEQQDSLVSVEETRRVEQFLLREARLLDGECWDAWLHGLSEAIHYWMPGIENRRPRGQIRALSPGTHGLLR